MQNIVRILAVIVIGALSTACSAEPVDVDIVPLPTKVEISGGVTKLPSDSQIINAANSPVVADYLQEILQSSTGFELPISTKRQVSKYKITLERLGEDAALGVEGYRLISNSNGVTISAITDNGLFYGVQTLLQLMPPVVYGEASPQTSWAVQHAVIEDTPRFSWRGVLLDLSRHFFDKEAIIRLIDRMAMHKMNVLHLHLTDDPGWRMEINAYPKLTSVGALGDRSDPHAAPQYLSQEDIEEIIRYASERFINVVPEIDMPGHAGAMARAYPEHSDGNITFNIGRAETYDFVETILEEVIELFPSKYIHFGGDELRYHRLLELSEVQDLMKKEGLANLHDIEEYFDRHVAEFIRSKGRVPMAWDEVANLDVGVPTVIQWWRAGAPETLDKAIANGHQVVMSPVDHLYLDYPQALGEPGAPWEGNNNGPNSLELIYNWKPIPSRFSSSVSEQFIGIEAGIWTEFIRSEQYLEYMTFPRLSAIAEVAWSRPDTMKYGDFQRRMLSQYKRYKELGINYRDPGEVGLELHNAQKYMTN